MKAERKQLSAQDKDRLDKFNWADHRIYKHFKDRLHRELAEYDPALIDLIKFQINAESELLREGCLKPRVRRSSDALRQVKVKSGMHRNQTCFLMTQQEMVVTHAQIRQILRWKSAHADWRMNGTTWGTDVPKFCTPKSHGDYYKQTLAEDELDRWNGFWEFSRFETNEFDVKPSLSIRLKNMRQK